jgi:hypothetical protein
MGYGDLSDGSVERGAGRGGGFKKDEVVVAVTGRERVYIGQW